MTEKSAVDWFVARLRQRGVEWIATLCGHGLDPLFDAATRAGIRLIDTRNEQSAAYLAECYGRLTGRPGVCASSSGVAVANALTGVINAWFDNAPMLCISGSANLATLGKGCFQDLDQAALARPVTRYSRLIDAPERAVAMLEEAWAAACQSPRGPSHLMFPMDVQRSLIGEAGALASARHSGVVSNPEALATAAEALRQSARPLIIPASEVFYNGEAAALLHLADRLRIPVQTPIWDRGICDLPRDTFLGVAGAASCDPGLPAMADCILVAGELEDYRLRQTANVHHVKGGWGELAGMAGALDFSSWLAEARRIRSTFTGQVRACAEQQRIGDQPHAIDIINALDHVLTEDATLIIDGGSIGQWAHHILCENRYPGYWLTCGRSGVVGYGIPGAMAARLAFPGKPVVLLSGDGAFTFTVADIECAVRQNLPFVAIVADDQCWGITHSGHLRQYGTGMATQLGAIRFDQLAESLGARGVRADQPDAIERVLRTALDTPGITVIHVPISGGNPSAQ